MASKVKPAPVSPPRVSFGAEQLASVYSRIDVLLVDERYGAAWAVAAELRGDPAEWQKAVNYVRDVLKRNVEDGQAKIATAEP